MVRKSVQILLPYRFFLMYLFTTCSTSSLSISLPICPGPNPSGVSGGVEGDVGDGGGFLTGVVAGEISAWLSTTGV